MSEPAGPTTPPARPSRAALRVTHASYSFACMRCGHGWEQSFAVEHLRDAEGRRYVRHVADGRVVPSPLTRPTCARCGNHLVRIMRAGRVAAAREAARRPERPAPAAAPAPAVPAAAGPAPAVPAAAGSVPAAPAAGGPVSVPRPRAARAGAGAGRRHHWDLSGLLHALHLHRRAG
ncbi:hypothetical protein GTU99_19165 [Streptomyces sp. PRKS01-65]|nr:hypothetical protein [Streptomyces harenosi]NEY34297.1 hypothetical protein [Streptomyces harenosi]